MGVGSIFLGDILTQNIVKHTLLTSTSNEVAVMDSWRKHVSNTAHGNRREQQSLGLWLVFTLHSGTYLSSQRKRDDISNQFQSYVLVSFLVHAILVLTISTVVVVAAAPDTRRRHSCP